MWATSTLPADLPASRLGTVGKEALKKTCTHPSSVTLHGSIYFSELRSTNCSIAQHFQELLEYVKIKEALLVLSWRAAFGPIMENSLLVPEQVAVEIV